MGKVSTNAGKHLYLRSDSQPIFKGKKSDGNFKELIALNNVSKILFKTIVDTGYDDSHGHKLFFADEVNYKNKLYKIDYDNINFEWSIIALIGEKRHKLSETHTEIFLTKKYSFR